MVQDAARRIQDTSRLNELQCALLARDQISQPTQNPNPKPKIEQSSIKYARRSGCNADALFEEIARANSGIDLKEFLAFCQEFDLTPSILSRREMSQLYYSEVGHAAVESSEKVSLYTAIIPVSNV